METEKKFEEEKRRLACECEEPATKRRVEDAVKNVGRLESLGLSRNIALIVSSRQYGLTEEKLAKTLSSKNN